MLKLGGPAATADEDDEELGSSASTTDEDDEAMMGNGIGMGLLGSVDSKPTELETDGGDASDEACALSRYFPWDLCTTHRQILPRTLASHRMVWLAPTTSCLHNCL